jgi:carbamoyl-phosphate synthase small subunit
MVFNTSMTGYQEILTDPSYAGQIITMTYPLIGNCGVNNEDIESEFVQVSGFIVKEASKVYSNFRATGSLQDYLKDNNIIAIEGVDTRKLTKHLREKGAMRGIISTDIMDQGELMALVQKHPSLEGLDLVQEVTCKKPYILPAKGEKCFIVAALDCGIKRSILCILASLGCEIHVFPATTPLKDLESVSPDGIFVSNGPGDPSAVTYVIETLKEIIALEKYPLFGICLGHQMFSLALGAKTYKLKFGHRGANHPVKDVLKETVVISSQNHGFCVQENSLDTNILEVSHWNLNDRTVAGIRHKRLPLYVVQYHPEASPGPQEAKDLFEEFIRMMEKSYSHPES